ncbi:MAG: Ycf48-like protein precursor, partial [Planctomycetaceae bacterium]|nr:Ycf48-like protein precursor [Planctomycetaceae bacterium]
LGLWAWSCCVGLPAFSDQPTPLQDDAALHDVQFAGTETGWAVGDHGVIWKTTDGGMTWDLQPSGVTCALRSVCFLTERVGWIAGGESVPYAQQGRGIVLKTMVGGAKWELVAGKPNIGPGEHDIPELHRIKFFTLTHGIAAGEANGRCASGIVVTTDGGKTWQAAPGDVSGSWRAADFVSPENGAVAGLRGQRALFGAGKLLKSKLGGLGLRGLHALKLLPTGEGWLVGDGGLVLHISQGGTVWESPKQGFDREVRDLFDFQAVAVRGKQIWIAGDPGSVVWHSADGGQSWEPQSTRQTLPISALCFPSDEIGWAVGALGTMLQTTDGGANWMAVRGINRRVAYLTAQSQADRVSIPTISAVSGEAGFRSLVTILPRTDVGSEQDGTRELDLKLSEAVMLAGGSSAQVGWRLPLDIPGLENEPEKLLAEWSKRSEGALKESLVAHYVRQFRTWRPSVVLLDEPDQRDALAKLIKLVVLKAIQQAGDATSQLAQQEIAQLPAWQVRRVFVRVPAGSLGQVNVSVHQMLPRQGCSLLIAAAPAIARLRDDPFSIPSRDAYWAITLAGEIEEYRGSDFFAQLGLSPDTDARRPLPPTNVDQFEQKRKLAQQQRNFDEYKKRYLKDGSKAQSLIAQLSDITQGMPDAQAALLMAQLADDYRRQGQWELAEATLIVMVDRFPHEPAAQDAMRWLLQLWVSSEMTYRRVRLTNVSKTRISVETEELIQRLRNIGQPQPETNEETLADDIIQTSGKKNSLIVEELPFQVETGRDGDLRQLKADLWQEKATRMAGLIRKTSPAWYQSPGVQFPLGSLYRQRHNSGPAAECFHRMTRGSEDSPWHKTAMTELWLNHSVGLPPKSFYNCRVIGEPPQLDGNLTESCWQSAEEMPLTSDQPNGTLRESAFVLICHDAEYLYLGGMCPRVPGTATEMPSRQGRSYDSNVLPYDRVTFLLDIDRDYTTYYRLTIDQRGWTAEDLWGDVTWNPKWFVAADGDEAAWRFEAAIPWKELVPTPPAEGAVWAASVHRTVPAIGMQSWTLPVSSKPKLETGGLIKFE